MPTHAADGEVPVWTTKPRSWRRRLFVRLGLALLSCTAIFLGQYFYRSWQADRELQAAVEEVDRRDPGWRLEELEAKRAVVPDARNGALVVLATAKLLPPNWTSKLILDTIDEIPPAVQLHPQHVAELQAELKVLAPAVQEARKLVTYLQGRNRIIWADNFIGTLVPQIDHARTVVHLLRGDARLRSQDGDGDGALASCRAMLNAGRSLGDEPLIISQLVRLACRHMMESTVERVLAQSQPSERALSNLQEALANDAREPRMRIGVRGERAGEHYMMTNLASGKISFSQVASDKKAPSLWDVLIDWLARPHYKQSHAWQLRYLTDVIEALDKPGAEQELLFQELKGRLKEAPSTAALFASGVIRAATAERRGNASTRCAVVGLAAERYRLKTGSWPKRLDDLVTASLLKAVPADPYDGAPLRFRRANDGLVIYSVGPEGKGDGTALDDGRFDPNEVRVEFRLWDVARRRQPPRPIPPETLLFPEEELDAEGP